MVYTKQEKPASPSIHDSISNSKIMRLKWYRSQSHQTMGF